MVGTAWWNQRLKDKGTRATGKPAELGLVHAFEHMGKTTYRLCGPVRHDHLVCRVCRLVIERTEKDHMDGFVAEEIYGVCSTCTDPMAFGGHPA